MKGDEKRLILKTVFQRKANWIGHILIKKLPAVIEGKLEESLLLRKKNPSVRRFKIFVRKRKYWVLKEEVRDRLKWREKVADEVRGLDGALNHL